MSYYGDYYAGDPGLFSFVKKLKLGRIVGTVLKSAPGVSGILSAVRQVRSAYAPRTAPIKIAPPQVNIVATPLQQQLRTQLAAQGAIRPRLKGRKLVRLRRAPATAVQKRLRAQYAGKY